MVELKGLHVVRTGGHEYIYAWRGGPRIKAKLGTPEFMRAYHEAVEAHRIPETGKFRSVVIRYKASPDFQRLAPTTRKVWGRWLDRVALHFGDLATAQFGRPERIRPVIRKWRATMAHQPRTADYGMQVLSRVLSYAVDPLAEIASNPCEGIKQLYAVNRADIIWTDADLKQLAGAASTEVMRAVSLGAATGLRAADLVRLSWSHVGEDAIVITTSKSRFTREAIIPLYDELRALLATIPKASTAVLVNSRKRPWTVDGLNSSFASAVADAKLKGRGLHFHDLRGTAATRFYLANLSERAIAEIMGWDEDTVSRIIRRYVDRKAAVQAAIVQMRQARTGTDSVKGAVKTPAGDPA